MQRLAEEAGTPDAGEAVVDTGTPGMKEVEPPTTRRLLPWALQAGRTTAPASGWGQGTEERECALLQAW